MSYLGDFKASTTVRFMFTTHASSGATVDPSSAFEAADLLIYKNDSDTQRTSTNGITMTSPFDSITGVHHVAIDLSDNSDAGFWAAGNDYMVLLSPDETVDSQTIAKVVAQFSIENRCVNWGQVASPSTTVNLSGTTVSTTNSIASGGIARASFAADTGLQTVRSNTAQSGANGSITLDASASSTDNAYNDFWVILTGGTGAGQVAYITDYDGTTKVATTHCIGNGGNWFTNPDNTTTFAIREVSRIPQVGVTGSVTGYVAANVTKILGVDVTETSSGRVAGGLSYFFDVASPSATMNDVGGGSAPSAAENAAAVWDYLTADMTTPNSVGDLVATNLDAAISSRSTLDASGIRTAVGLASADLDTQLDKLDTLPASTREAMRQFIARQVAHDGLHHVAASANPNTTGTVSSGTYTDTASENAVTWETDQSGRVILQALEFDVGTTGEAISLRVTGYMFGTDEMGYDNEITIMAYDYVSADWDTLYTWAGSTSTTIQELPLLMLSGRNTGTSGGDDGIVTIQFLQNGTAVSDAKLVLDLVDLAYYDPTLGGAGGLDAAGVRAAIGLATANLDTQLADLPTVSEFNARTLLSADYFDPATDTVATVASVTAIATGGISADSFAAGAIDSAAVANSAWQELIELCFTYDATADYASAHAGSLVKQIADNAGGSALTVSDIADEVETRELITGDITAAALAKFFTLDSTSNYGASVAGSVVKEIADNAAGSGGLDAAGVRAAVGLASANLDTQLGDLATQTSVDNVPTVEEIATRLETSKLAKKPVVRGG